MRRRHPARTARPGSSPWRWAALVLLLAILAAALPSHSVLADDVERLAAQAEGTARTGVALAILFTKLSAIAFCPILGITFVGAWTYWSAPEIERTLLPFFFQPWFVGVCGLLSLLFLGKATVLQFIPALKKPMDMLAVLTNGAGALVLFIPVLFRFGQSVRGAGAPLALLGLPSFTVHAADGAAAAAPTAPWVFVGLAVAFAAVAYWALWLLGNVANAMILANPVPFLDVLVMAAIGAVLGGLGLASWIHPYLGLAAALVLALLAIWSAGWAFRWSVFALVFSWDFLTFRKDERWLTASRLRAFSGAGLSLPKRTMGWLLLQADGSLRFVHRPWLLGPERTAPIERGSLELGRALTHPCVVRRQAAGGKARVTVRLAPRYRRQYERLSAALALPVTDIGLRGGLLAAWRWCWESFAEWRGRSAPPAAQA